MRVYCDRFWLSTRSRGLLWMGLSVFGLFAGCWQEVEYAAPATPESSSAETRPEDSGEPVTETDAGGEEFADELATTLSEEPATTGQELTSEMASTDQADPSEIATPAEASAPTDTSSSDDLFADVPTGDEVAVETDTTAITEPARPTEGTESSGATAPDGKTSSAPSYDPLFDDPIEPASPVTDETPESDSLFPTNEGTPEPPPSIMPSPTDPTAANAEGTAGTSTNKVERAAWLLGSKLSLAALAHGKGAPGEDVQSLMEQSRTLARLFGMTVPDLPVRAIGAASDEIPEKALDYLFAEGNQIGTELARRQGVEVAALFEVAVKSNILLVLYRPGSPAVDAISTAISQAGTRGELPAELWQPLVDLLGRQAPTEDVRAGVYRMHTEVDRYFEASAAE